VDFAQAFRRGFFEAQDLRAICWESSRTHGMTSNRSHRHSARNGERRRIFASGARVAYVADYGSQTRSVSLRGSRKAFARRKRARRRRARYPRSQIQVGPDRKEWGAPLVCDDGVTIAKEFDLEDPEENLGARMIRQAAERTGDAVGDGTSTSTLLAHAIFADGLRNVAAGASAIDLKRGLERGLSAAVASLREQSRPVKAGLERMQVATISAHSDAKMGKLVASSIPPRSFALRWRTRCRSPVCCY
jgi:hypothetical protein